MERTSRTRWAAVGAAVAIALGAVGAATITAAPNTSPATLSPITPCRLLDTRPGDLTVGPRSTPLAAGETYSALAWGTNGECTIPSTATGLSLNVTAVNGSAASFLTVFPADVTLPKASSLNWQPGQSATPNAVTSPLSADGRLALYNFAGTVDVVVDVVGYYSVLPAAPTLPPTTLAPYAFEATVNVAASNGYFALAGFNQTATFDVRGVGWRAPRACTMTGTATVTGGVQAGTGFALSFSRWSATTGSLIGNGPVQSVTTSSVSGTSITLGSVSVNAGELVTLSELFSAGTTLVANTKVHLTARCA